MNSQTTGMGECKKCELAIYCFSESSTWIFRTKQEMEEKRTAMDNCPVYRQVHSGVLQDSNGIGAS